MDGLPNVAAVWVDYFLLVIVKRQQTISDPVTNSLDIFVLARNLGGCEANSIRCKTSIVLLASSCFESGTRSI